MVVVPMAVARLLLVPVAAAVPVAVVVADTVGLR